jgi:hypothetical protein
MSDSDRTERRGDRAFEEARAFLVREVRQIADDLERVSRGNAGEIERLFAKLGSTREAFFGALIAAR